jgi:hypothetical protein
MPYETIVDSKAKITSTDTSAPGFPSVKEMRKSQAAGNEGIGLNDKSFNESMADFNMDACINGASDDDEPTPSEGAGLPFLP